MLEKLKPHDVASTSIPPDTGQEAERLERLLIKLGSTPAFKDVG